MTTKATNRPNRDENQRVPVFEARRDAITVTNRDSNFEYRIVNDIDDRIATFKRGGWELVESGAGTEFSSGEASTMGSVQARSVGGGVTGYLMRIKKDWYDEDQAKKATAIQEEEDHITKTGKYTEAGAYGSVRISRGT